MNICLVSANDVMEHFAFPGNIDFAADDEGAFHVLFMKFKVDRLQIIVVAKKAVVLRL